MMVHAPARSRNCCVRLCWNKRDRNIDECRRDNPFHGMWWDCYGQVDWLQWQMCF